MHDGLASLQAQRVRLGEQSHRIFEEIADMFLWQALDRLALLPEHLKPREILVEALQAALLLGSAKIGNIQLLSSRGRPVKSCLQPGFSGGSF